MATIRADQTTRISLGASLSGAPDSTASTLRFSRGLNTLAQGAQNLTNALTGAAIDFQTRDNQRKVYEATRDFKNFRTETLFGAEGVTRRQGNSAEGVTEETTRRLNEFVQERVKTAPNHVVQRLLEEELGKSVGDTMEFLARHEATELEQGRRATASVLFSQSRQEAVRFERDRLRPGAAGGSDEKFQEQLGLYQEYLNAANPDASDEAISVLSKQAMAEDAVQAVFAAMDQGVQNVGEAREIQAFWEKQGLWSPSQIEAVNRRIVDEVSFGVMDQIVAQVGSRLGAGASELEMRAEADKLFAQQYKAQFGQDPPSDLVTQMRAKVTNFNTLLDANLREKKSQFRANTLSRVAEVATKGNVQQTLAQIESSLKEAIKFKDTELQSSLMTMQANFAETQSVHPKNMTERGNELYLEGSLGLTKEEMLSAQGFMTAAVWRDWAKDGVEALEKGISSGEELDVTSTSAIKDIVLTHAADFEGKTSLSKAETARRMRQMRIADQRFVELNKRKPNPDELFEMANALRFSLNDRGREGGAFTGSVGEFLSAPTLSRGALDKEQHNDRFLLEVARDVLNADFAVREAILGGDHYLSPDTRGRLLSSPGIGIEQLEEDPELTRQILLFALASGTPLLARGQGDQTDQVFNRTGRANLSAATDTQKGR